MPHGAREQVRRVSTEVVTSDADVLAIELAVEAAELLGDPIQAVDDEADVFRSIDEARLGGTARVRCVRVVDANADVAVRSPLLEQLRVLIDRPALVW